MLSVRKTVLVLLTIVVLVALPFEQAAVAQFRPDAAEPDAAAMIIDVVPVRVLSFCGLVIGTVAYVVTLPLAYISGSQEMAAQKMVVEPARYTFIRPLGDFR
jgi:hypothetical protein